MKPLIPTEQAEKAAQKFVKVSEVNSQRIQDAYLLATQAANTAYITDVLPVLLACNLHLHDLKTTLEIIIKELPKLAETISAKKDLEKVKSTITQLTELLKR